MTNQNRFSAPVILGKTKLNRLERVLYGEATSQYSLISEEPVATEHCLLKSAWGKSPFRGFLGYIPDLEICLAADQ
jgi:hypothetical protein